MRLAIPVGLGAIAALGHEGWAGGLLALLVGCVCAFLITPERRRTAFAFGWLFGLGYFGVMLRWIVEPFLVDVARHGWMAPFVILFMAGGLALFWAAAFWMARHIAGARPSVMVWLPVTLATAELARGHVFTGFPWGLPSYVVIGGLGDIWFALIGPYGATFAVLAIAGALAYFLHRRAIFIVPLLGTVVLATFALSLSQATTMPQTGQTVRLIQPNAPQHLKWDPDWMGMFFNRALDQTRAGDAPDVVIWPETSIPTLLEYADPLIADMATAARGAPIVAGIQRRDVNDYYNAAILIDGPSTVSVISDKAHLVPFGEYIPLAHLLEPLGLGTLVDQVAGFSRGTGDGMMQTDGLGLARVLICYEGIFPEEMQRGSQRADVLLIITNDAWFGKGAGPRQHLVQAQARAIEQGLPVIRAANTGISAVIDARGRIIDALDLNEAGYLDVLVPGPLPPTVYARTGDWPLAVLLMTVIGLGVARTRRKSVDDVQPHS